MDHFLPRSGKRDNQNFVNTGHSDLEKRGKIALNMKNFTCSKEMTKKLAQISRTGDPAWNISKIYLPIVAKSDFGEIGNYFTKPMRRMQKERSKKKKFLDDVLIPEFGSSSKMIAEKYETFLNTRE